MQAYQQYPGQSGRPFDIFIELDQPGAVYEPRQEITGRVTVRAHTARYVPELRVEVQGYVHGRVRTLATSAAQRVFSGQWHAGQTYSYPFRVNAPLRMRPYQGHKFNVDVRVAAVLPDQNDPSWVERLTGLAIGDNEARINPVALVPIDIAPERRHTILDLKQENVRSEVGNRGGRLLIGLVLVVLGFAGMLGGLTLALLPGDSTWWHWTMGISGLVFVIIGLVQTFAHLGPWMAQRKIGEPQIQAQLRPTPQGGAFDIYVRLAPQPQSTRVRAGLRLMEEVTIEGGSSSHTEHHTLIETTTLLERSPEPGLFYIALPVPPPGTWPTVPDFRIATVVWQLVVQVELPFWPDWEVSFPIYAQPVPREQTQAD